MKTLITYSILLISLKANSQSGFTKTIQDGSFEFTLKLDSTEFNETTYLFRLYKVEVRKVGSNVVIQEILANPNNLHGEQKELFSLVDMNFDGVKDVQLFRTRSTNLEVSFNCYIFNADSGQFIFNPELSDLRNPTFLADCQSIHEYHRVGSSERTHSLYKWKNGKLLLVLQEKEENSGSSDFSTFTTVTELKAGKYQVVENNSETTFTCGGKCWMIRKLCK